MMDSPSSPRSPGSTGGAPISEPNPSSPAPSSSAPPSAKWKYEAVGLPASAAEAEAVALWNQRGPGPNDAVFRWGYLRNPFGDAHCFLLRATDERLAERGPMSVGTVGIGVRRIEVPRSGVSTGNGSTTLSACVLGDFFVLKAHRTFFPALTMQRAVLGWGRKNFDLVYGFPNASAQPIIKRLGFKPLASLDRHVLVLRHARYLKKRIETRLLQRPRFAPFAERIAKVGGRLLAVPMDGFRRFVHPRTSLGPPAGHRFERFDRIDERFDRLFETRAIRDLTIGHRDAKLLQWRFLDRPDQRAGIYGLVDASSGRLRAYIALHIAKDLAYIRDLLGVDADAMGETLRLAAGIARREGCVSLSFTCAAPPALAERLEALGFRKREEDPRILFGFVGDSVENPEIRAALDRWYVTEADEDQ
jgi:hypothetical protein